MASNFLNDAQNKLDACRGKKPPRPKQLQLVMMWPYFGLDEEIFCDPSVPENFKFKPKGLLLYGDSGTGKTVAALNILLDVWDKKDCGWRAGDLGRAITEASRGGDGELEALSQKLCRSRYLFIDDIDKARFTDRVQSEFFSVIDAREINSKPVIITTNTTGVGLAKLFTSNVGKPIVNRLVRMCYSIDFDNTRFNFTQELAEIQADLRQQLRIQLEIAEEEAEEIKKEEAERIDREIKQREAEIKSEEKFQKYKAYLIQHVSPINP